MDEEQIKDAILKVLNSIDESVESNRRMTLILSRLVPHFWDQMCVEEADRVRLTAEIGLPDEGNIELARLLARVIAKELPR